MSSATALPRLTVTNRWQLGSMLVFLSLSGVGFALLSLILSPSVVLLHGVLGCYLPVFASALLCAGVFCLPGEVRWSLDSRICGLCCLLLSPFATWAVDSMGSSYLNVNSILWQFFALGCMRMVIRLYAQECSLRDMGGMSLAFQVVYWLFVLTVFAPFCARGLDVCWVSYAFNTGLVLAGDIWQLPWPLLDSILKGALLAGVFGIALCSLLVMLRFQDVAAQAGMASEGSEPTSSKEQESNGDDIDSGAGCVQ